MTQHNRYNIEHVATHVYYYKLNQFDKISDRAELYGCATFWAALGNTTHSDWLKQKLKLILEF